MTKATFSQTIKNAIRGGQNRSDMKDDLLQIAVIRKSIAMRLDSAMNKSDDKEDNGNKKNSLKLSDDEIARLEEVQVSFKEICSDRTTVDAYFAFAEDYVLAVDEADVTTLSPVFVNEQGEVKQVLRLMSKHLKSGFAHRPVKAGEDLKPRFAEAAKKALASFGLQADDDLWGQAAMGIFGGLDPDVAASLRTAEHRVRHVADMVMSSKQRERLELMCYVSDTVARRYRTNETQHAESQRNARMNPGLRTGFIESIVERVTVSFETNTSRRGVPGVPGMVTEVDERDIVSEANEDLKKKLAKAEALLKKAQKEKDELAKKLNQTV